MENNALMLQSNVNGTYCSIKPKTLEEKKTLYNALETCDNLVNDCVGAVINLKNVYIERRLKDYEEELDSSYVDSETGEVIDKKTVQKTKYRTILFADDGTTYATGSYGIYNAVAKLIATFGDPETWEEPITVEFAKRPIGNGKTSLTLKLV